MLLEGDDEFFCELKTIYESYMCKDGFVVEINRREKEAWLFHLDYGVKMSMFKIEKGDILMLVRGVLDEYKQIYKDLYAPELIG